MPISSWIAAAVTVGLIALPCNAAVYPNLMDGISGYWPFDETTGGIAHEASGNGVNGALVNYPANQGTWVPGQIGGALDFGGPDARQYVRVPNFIKPNTSLTFSAWVLADSLPQWAAVAANWNGLYGMFNYGLLGSDPRMSLYFALFDPQGINVASGTESSASSLAIGQWHHVAVVVDGNLNDVRFWRDGRLTGRSVFHDAQFYPPPHSYFDIGGDSSNTNPNQGFWDGRIDDFALWTRALSGGEILAIYTAGLNGQSLLSVIPEPNSFALLAPGLLLLRVRARRRDQK